MVGFRRISATASASISLQHASSRSIRASGRLRTGMVEQVGVSGITNEEGRITNEEGISKKNILPSSLELLHSKYFFIRIRN
jgi:hypothetical protein